MALGLSSNFTKERMPVASHVTSNLKMLHRYNAGSVVPVSDGSVYFDNSAAINTGNEFKSTIAAGDISVAFWVKSVEGSGATGNIFFLGAKQTSSEDIFHIGHASDGTVLCRIEGNDDSDTISGAHILVANHPWTHIAVTFAMGESAGGDGKIYINGVLDATTSLSSITKSNWNAYDNGQNIYIGARNNNGSIQSGITGHMCNVGIWSEILTQAQIKSIMWKNYAGLIDSEKTNLVSWWNLDTETNTSGEAGTGGVKDSHGTNHGTLS